LPAKDLVDILVGSGPVHLHLGRPSMWDHRSAYSPEFEDRVRNESHVEQLDLIAPTPERARQLAQAALVLCDYGYSLPTHQGYVNLQQYWEPIGSELRRLAKGDEQELAVCQKQLEDLTPWSDMGTSEARHNLAVQQRLIAVDEAGIAARIQACEKILKEGKGLTPARIDQVETIKTTAEIELVGLAAKRMAIEQIIEKARQYSALRIKETDFRNRLERCRRYVAEAELNAAVFAKAVREKTAFAVVEGKIPIRRIRWEQPKPAASPK
jgi:hypothetical protein